MAAPPEGLELSLNEVEALAQKAARGAGLAWGLADDAGRSARWLAGHGADWASILLALLDTPPPPAVCPLRQGCYLADCAAAPGRHHLARVVAPAWLLPPLFAAVSVWRIPIALWLDDAVIMVGAEATASRPWSALLATGRAAVAVQFGAGATTLPHRLQRAAARPRPVAALTARLDAYAARTYVPASELSRARGAGSGASDEE